MIKFFAQRHVGHCTVLFTILLLLAGGCTPPTNQMVAASESAEEEPEPVAITVFTEKAQLFMEYPRLVPGLSARFLAHVTVLATGAPIRTGELRLELSEGPGGARALEAAQPTRDGLFIPVGTFDAPGVYQARIVVTSDQLVETFPLEPIVVHADLPSAFAAAEAEVQAEPADLVPFLLEQQWKIGLLMKQVETRSMTRRLQVPGEVEAPYHGMAVASAPLAGRLLPREGESLPRLGDWVEKGQVLAILEPPLTASDAAQLSANKTNNDTLEMGFLMREFDAQAKALEIEQALMQSEIQLGFARQSLARIEGLREKDLGTVAELQAARRDVQLAEQASEGSRALEVSFTQAKEQLDALSKRSAAVRSSASSSDSPSHVLVAPISGEIVGVEHIEGEHVESQGVVYRLLDLSSIWVTAHISEFDLAEIGDAPGASVSFAAYPDRTFDVIGEMQGRLVNVGRVVDPETRTIALRYEAANPDGLFRAGMFADVFLETERATDAVSLPKEAVVMDNGQPVAFVLIHGEAFQKRVLELGIRDGEFVEVRSGIQHGDRVVTKGAYLVKLASASPASFGEGHAH
ncbi:MAG: cobalt-zinc-cadmium efflux system membrane fusion protein [Gammaproteobacteria bacterium]|jgi:cobalt-zinc-cadmium efflux system membrane fusion protein